MSASGIGVGGVGSPDYSVHDLGVSVHRSAALVTGAAGTFVTIDYDTSNDNVPTASASSSGGVTSVGPIGVYCVAGLVRVVQLALMTGASVRVVRGGVVVYQDTRAAVAVGGEIGFPFCVPLHLADGQTIEIQVASLGVGGAVVVVGREACFLTVAGV